MKGKGFTLIEAIIIIAVVAILAALIAPMIFKSTEQERYKRAESELKTIYEAIFGDGKTNFGYHGDMGNLPPDLRCLAIPSSDNCDRPDPKEWPSGSGVIIGWKGPYLSPQRVDADGNFLDPWGNMYQMKPLSSDPDTWQLASAGPDGQIDWSNSTASVNQDNVYYPDSPINVSNHWNSDYYQLLNPTYFSSKIKDVENFPYIKYKVCFPIDGEDDSGKGICTETDWGQKYFQDSNGNPIGIPYGKWAFWGNVYNGGDSKFFIGKVPLGGKLHIFVDATYKSDSTLMDGIDGSADVDSNTNQIEIHATSALNSQPSGGKDEDDISIEVVGIGTMRWSSDDSEYQLYLPYPPYDPGNDYTFTLVSNGGASCTLKYDGNNEKGSCQ